jgi:hypothetical protein
MPEIVIVTCFSEVSRMVGCVVIYGRLTGG